MSTLTRTSWERSFSVGSKNKIRQFALAIDDRNPLHHDDEAAQKAGFRAIIAPGVMTLGMVSAAIAEEIPGVLICELKMRFRRPLYAGATPSVQCTVTMQGERYVELAIVVNNEGEPVAKGSCLLKLPRE